MQFVSIRDLRLKPTEVWKRLKEEHELVVTLKGRPVYVVTEAKGDIEETLIAIRRAKAQVAVGQIRKYAAQRGLNKLSTDDIDKLIRTVRRGRKK